MMDHLAQAKHEIDKAGHIYASSADATAGIVQAQLATTYALIALVEI